MKTLDKVGLVVFSCLMLIISILNCILIFGWMPMDTAGGIVKTIIQDDVASKILLGISVFIILLAIKCIFFNSDGKEINGVKDGILLENSDGKLVISKITLEELVNSTVKGFESAKNITSKIALDEEKNIIVYVLIDVTENAVIKELSNNIQTKVKSAIKKSSDLEVKEVNVSVRNLKTEESEIVE